ncbi:MAG TPA: MBL fold metallo-hydrolase [Terracidiphilus sp.]|nr:MBL fold metallo-hydrolase [Terracidiphilus sp.]
MWDAPPAGWMLDADVKHSQVFQDNPSRVHFPQMRIPVFYPLNIPRRQVHTRVLLHLLLPFCVLLFSAQQPRAQENANSAKHLLIYSIDVEGGQSTLLVAPSGASLLVDTGWPGHDDRDADRIQAAMKDAGITKIDHVLITHYHTDHVGGVPDLVKHIKVGEFIDHGENREDSDITRHDYAAYLKAIAGTPRRSVHPGDTIQIPGLSIVVLAAAGEHILRVPGTKPEPNSYCAAEKKWPDDPSENARSTGILVTFGKFRFLDLGDLTGAKEVALVCPNNPIPPIDLYLVNHHGMNLSNSRALVDAIHPRVAIMNNGAHKAGMPEAWQTVHDSPGLEDLYMLHTAEGSDAAHNSPEALIANPKGSTTDGAYFKVAASAMGSFSVTNSRTGKSKEYPRK